MKISYNWLKWYIDGDLPTPEKLEDILTFKLCEVEGVEQKGDDMIFDLNILPNRAHDLLSHQGVAREIAGILGMKFKDPTPLYKVPESKPTDLKIEIGTDMCRRYMGRIVRNIKIGPSPEWVVQHLESIGQRSINNIVDATNIVMYDCGQPCHAFDLQRVTHTAETKIVITQAQGSEEFPVLGSDKVVAKLKDTDMMITNGIEPLAIAGVKGGLDSGVTDTTTDIILEVANFDPVSVRKTARRLGLLSDSAKRFENDLSPTLGDFGMLELSALIYEMCPDAIFEEIIDIYPESQQNRTITFSTSRINKMLGTAISEPEMIGLLQIYGYEISGKEDEYILHVPPLRLDLTGVHDITEEVLRLYGLDKITPALPVFSEIPKINTTEYQISAIHQHLTTQGFREVMTYTFRKKGFFEVAHGVGDKGALRINLLDGLKESYELNRLNAPLLEIDEVKIFEIGNVFSANGEQIHVATSDKKSSIEMTLDEYCQKNNIIIGTTYNTFFESADSLEQTKKFIPWSHYPFITRDIAVWVPEHTDQNELISLYVKHGGELLVVSPRLFDQFTKEGRTSLAFRLVFQAEDRTLTDGEINNILQKITDDLTEKSFEVR